MEHAAHISPPTMDHRSREWRVGMTRCVAGFDVRNLCRADLGIGCAAYVALGYISFAAIDAIEKYELSS
jgi:hypothetical protein